MLFIVFILGFSVDPVSAEAAPKKKRNIRITDKETKAWQWSYDAQHWVFMEGLLPKSLAKQGSDYQLNRRELVNALAKLEQQNVKQRRGVRRLTGKGRSSAPQLRDAKRGTVAARSIQLRWLQPVKGGFAGNRKVTANEATVAVMSALGFRNEIIQLSRTLKREAPQMKGSYQYAAADTLARTLKLRYNVLEQYDDYELGPNDRINKAHVSYMLHSALKTVTPWQAEKARLLATDFRLPHLTKTQRQIITRGFEQIGHPYVWGGSSELRTDKFPGFDCSGFVMRVVNDARIDRIGLPYLKERTTYTQSAIPVKNRIVVAKLEPGDIMFFGAKNKKGNPDDNYHAALYLGNNWFIHSSGSNAGVAIDYLDDWWLNEFSWGRRMLRPA